MLNYIWLALLFLGIGAAVSTDIVNQSRDKYRNNQPLSSVIEFAAPVDSIPGKSYEGTIKIKSADYNRFYNESISSDISLPAKITFSGKNKPAALFFKIDKTAPKILTEIASASGKEDDVTGSVKILNFTSGTSANVKVIFEEVSFLKLKDITNASLSYAGTAVEIAIGLIGIMALWLGIMKIAEEAGLIAIIANALKPLTKRLFPEVPSDHPAMGSMIMNISANILGLGNAATPFGLKAMEELDKLNPEKGTATNSMVTFLAINTAGMTLIPATAIAIRAASGSSDPAIIIGTSLFGSLCATITGITAAKVLEKFPLRANSEVLAPDDRKARFTGWLKNNTKIFSILGLIIFIILLIIYTGLGKSLGSSLSFFSPGLFKSIIQIFSTIAIPLLIIVFVGYGALKKVRVYESFVEGAKEGFNISVRIIPYLVAMLVAIGIFRAGGAMDWLIYALRPLTDFIGMPAEALPMALMRPLSGSGSLGIMAEIISVHGPDSLLGIMVSTFYGSTETTFYVLALYFGSVNIKKTRHALPAGLLADIAGILGAVFIVRLLFG